MKMDSEEINNLFGKPTVKNIFMELNNRLTKWQWNTNDPWVCSPHAVLEDKGPYQKNAVCMDL